MDNKADTPRERGYPWSMAMTALGLVPADNEVDPLTREVARILTRAKVRAGLSFTELGLVSGLGRASVVRYLAGERSPQLDAFIPLCEALELDPSAVIAEAQRAAGWQ